MDLSSSFDQILKMSSVFCMDSIRVLVREGGREKAGRGEITNLVKKFLK